MKKLLLITAVALFVGAGCAQTTVSPQPVVEPVPQQRACGTNADCKPGESCMVTGPLIAGQPVKKVCVPPGTAVPL